MSPPKTNPYGLLAAFTAFASFACHGVSPLAAVTYFTGEAATPFFPFQETELTAVFTTTFCHFVHFQLLVGERLESR